MSFVPPPISLGLVGEVVMSHLRGDAVLGGDVLLLIVDSLCGVFVVREMRRGKLRLLKKEGETLAPLRVLVHSPGDVMASCVHCSITCELDQICSREVATSYRTRRKQQA